MLNPPAKCAGFSTTQRQPDSRFSTSKPEETPRRSMWAIRMRREYRFLSSSRGSPSQRCAIVRAALDIPRTCHNECIVNTPKRRQPRRSHSAVNSSFVGVPRRIDDQFRASQESIAGKDFTTLAHIERMRELCRVSARAQGSTNERPSERTDASLGAPSGPSVTANGKLPQESLRAKLKESRQRPPRTP